MPVAGGVMTYTDKIRTLLAVTGDSVDQLAVKLDISRATLYALLNGRSRDIRSRRNRQAIDAMMARVLR